MATYFVILERMIEVQECQTGEEWDDYVLEHAGHPLQLWAWGEVKHRHGWLARRLFVVDEDKTIGAAQVLVKKLPWPFTSLSYIPRGPLAAPHNREEVLNALGDYVKTDIKSVALSIEPDWEEMPHADGWVQASNTILLPHTIVLDLTKSEGELMDAMTKKTRQYIRKSEREVLDIRQVKTQEELQSCLEIYKTTAERAGFALHKDEYYHDIKQLMGDCSPVWAVFEDDQPVSFLWLAISESVAFELYGGVTDRGQELRANYILKWRAIQAVKKWGIERYDMNGLLNDGVSTFKQGFASHETQLAGTYDRPLSPLYKIWTQGLPTAKKVVRRVKSLRK